MENHMKKNREHPEINIVEQPSIPWQLQHTTNIKASNHD